MTIILQLTIITGRSCLKAWPGLPLSNYGSLNQGWYPQKCPTILLPYIWCAKSRQRDTCPGLWCLSPWTMLLAMLKTNGYIVSHFLSLSRHFKLFLLMSWSTPFLRIFPITVRPVTAFVAHLNAYRLRPCFCSWGILSLMYQRVFADGRVTKIGIISVAGQTFNCVRRQKRTHCGRNSPEFPAVFSFVIGPS